MADLRERFSPDELRTMIRVIESTGLNGLIHVLQSLKAVLEEALPQGRLMSDEVPQTASDEASPVIAKASLEPIGIPHHVWLLKPEAFDHRDRIVPSTAVHYVHSWGEVRWIQIEPRGKLILKQRCCTLGYLNETQVIVYAYYAWLQL